MSLSNSTTGDMSSVGVSRNALIKITTLGLTSLIEIWYASFLVANLGVDLYGVLALATNVIMFGAIINITVISSLGRFISIEIHRGELKRAIEFYNTGYRIVLFICAGLFLISLTISWYAPVIFKIPDGFENSSRFLFFAVMLSFIMSFAVSAISVGTFVYNRLDLNDWLNFGKVVSSRGLAAILIVFCGWKISAVSLGLLFAVVFTIMGGVFIHNKLTPEFDFVFSSLKGDIVRKIMVFSSWSILRQLCVRTLIFADLFIVNHLYGATQSGLYAVAFFFPSKLRILTGPFAGLLKPIILNRYAKEDFAGMVKIVSQGIRLVGVVFAFPVGFLCGLYRVIFTIWVGTEYQPLYWIAVILTCHVSLNVSCYPLFAIQDAFNRVKIPSLFSCVMAGVYFLLALTLGSPDVGIGVAGVALAGALSLTLNHAIFSPVYTAFLLKVSPWLFYKSFIPGVLGCALTAFFLNLVSQWHSPSTIYELLLLFIASGATYCLVSWCILLSDPEREFIAKSFFGLKRRFF